MLLGYKHSNSTYILLFSNWLWQPHVFTNHSHTCRLAEHPPGAPVNNISMWLAVLLLLPLHLREIRHARPGQPAPRWRQPQRAVGWDRGGHLLRPARGHQQEYGERQGSGWFGRHREAGEHHQGQRRQASLLQGDASPRPSFLGWPCDKCFGQG